MTDLGGGYHPQGSQPWHPTDPWQQQAQQQDPYYGQQQGQQGQPGYPQQQQPHPQQGWPQQQGQYGQQQGQQGYPRPQQQDPYYGQQQGQQSQQGYPRPQQQMPQQQVPPPQYVQQPQRPQQPQRVVPPQAPRPSGPGPDGIDWEAEAAALDAPRVEPEPEVWNEDPVDEFDEPEPEPESFFGGEQDNSRDAERKRKEKGKKTGRRNSGACLLVALVLLGGVGGAGWWGYGFYQSHFGPPPDYTGEGAGAVNVEIKLGSSGEAMGAVLRDAGVVKSSAAFVTAFSNNPKAATIQPGAYTMHHEMSAKAAVALMVESNGGNALVIPEGKKAVDIYALIDNKLKLQKGATAGVAKDQANNLGLPDYAKGNLEGFLFPARYSVSEGMKPEDMLKQMVSTAVQHYSELKLDEGAQKVGLHNAYELITEASILQAEGNNDKDFGKIARVLYNRLNTNATFGKLQLDTTLQYKLGRTKFTAAEKDGDKSPYNTYVSKGLPPTPISNPGDEAIKAVLNPTPGDWVYFVALSPTETRFSVKFEDFKKDVKDYCTANHWGFDPVAGMCKS